MVRLSTTLKSPLVAATFAAGARCASRRSTGGGPPLGMPSTQSIPKAPCKSETTWPWVKHPLSVGSINRAFLNMVPLMISFGEGSDALDEMLDNVANRYEETADNALDSLSSLMEPLIMSILCVLVGGLMVTMRLPIVMLRSVI